MSGNQYTFEIAVAKNGHFLFRTEKALNVMRNLVLEEIVKKFPAEEGYEVCIVDWPMPKGDLTTIHKPMPEMTPEQQKRLQQFQDEFIEQMNQTPDSTTVTVLYHMGQNLIEKSFQDVKQWAVHELDKWEADERRKRRSDG